MWQPIRIGSNDYIIKKINRNDNYDILLSDFVNIWGEESTSTSLFQRCKSLNPLVEGDQENLVQWVLSQLNKSNAQLSIKECDDAKILQINSKLAGVPFSFRFYLKVMDQHKLYDEMTLPLLLMIQQLQAQKHMLFDLLKKKDVEISEYKMEGARLSRKNVETSAFDEKQFDQMCTSIQVPCEAVGHPAILFTQELQALYPDVVKKYEDSKKENCTAEQQTDTTDNGAHSVSDSSPDKKRKNDHKNETQTQNQIKHNVNKREEDCIKREEEEKLIAKRRKEATKKKRLAL